MLARTTGSSRDRVQGTGARHISPSYNWGQFKRDLRCVLGAQVKYGYNELAMAGEDEEILRYFRRYLNGTVSVSEPVLHIDYGLGCRYCMDKKLDSFRRCL